MPDPAIIGQHIADVLGTLVQYAAGLTTAFFAVVMLIRWFVDLIQG